MTSLFDPLKVGDLTLKNRIVMAPLTRARSGVERTPARWWRSITPSAPRPD